MTKYVIYEALAICPGNVSCIANSDQWSYVPATKEAIIVYIYP